MITQELFKTESTHFDALLLRAVIYKLLIFKDESEDRRNIRINIIGVTSLLSYNFL